jgi:hypothetical protein
MYTEYLKGRYHSGDQDIDMRVILEMDFVEIVSSGVDWIRLAKDSDRCRSLV